MNIKQQLEQVIAVIEKEITNGHVAPSGQNYLVKKAALLSWRNSLSAIVEQMPSASAEPVAWMRYGSDGNPIDVLIGDEPMEFLHGRNAPLYTAPQVPDGMVLVPKEPTADMIVAGNRAMIWRELRMGSAHSALHTVRGCYKAMIAAAKEEGSAS